MYGCCEGDGDGVALHNCKCITVVSMPKISTSTHYRTKVSVQLPQHIVTCGIIWKCAYKCTCTKTPNECWRVVVYVIQHTIPAIPHPRLRPHNVISTLRIACICVCAQGGTASGYKMKFMCTVGRRSLFIVQRTSSFGISTAAGS